MHDTTGQVALPLDRLWNTKQASTYMGVSIRTLFTLTHAPDPLPAFKIGRRVLFEPWAVITYARGREMYPPE